VISSLAEPMLLGQEDIDGEDNHIPAIKQTADSLPGLVDSLIHSDTLESGEFVLRKKTENIASIVTSVVDLNQSAARQKGISLKLETADALHGHFDSLRLRTAMDNYISNAIKFTPPDSQVRVSLKEIGNAGRRSCEFKVIDTGPGLSENDFAMVFERFAKLSARPTADEPSSGIGLSIVNRIIELHGGSVEVRNNDGGGACFSFIIPLSN
jgi:signal transduction histidine kinase